MFSLAPCPSGIRRGEGACPPARPPSCPPKPWRRRLKARPFLSAVIEAGLGRAARRLLSRSVSCAAGPCAEGEFHETRSIRADMSSDDRMSARRDRLLELEDHVDQHEQVEEHDDAEQRLAQPLRRPPEPAPRR